MDESAEDRSSSILKLQTLETSAALALNQVPQQDIVD